MTINFFNDVIVPRLPSDLSPEEFDQIKAMIKMRYYQQLTAQDQATMMSINADMKRQKKREFDSDMRNASMGMTIDESKAEELAYLEKSPLVYAELKRAAEITGNMELLRDVERFKETPDIPLIKHFHGASWLHQRQLVSQGLIIK
jgi:hypothetical protein